MLHIIVCICKKRNLYNALLLFPLIPSILICLFMREFSKAHTHACMYAVLMQVSGQAPGQVFSLSGLH